MLQLLQHTHSSSPKALLLKVGIASGLGLLLGSGVYFTEQESHQEASASENQLKPPQYPWNHRFPWQAFDHASIRRGFQVYQEVCATCHSLDKIAYRHLVNIAYTEEEAKALAAEKEIQDGPDEQGEMFTRPGKLSDYFPRPYPNKQAARFANNGALPVDQSLVVKARGDHEDYIFSLMTGYREAPAGVNLRQGLYYNPYFPGGAIAMPSPLAEGMLTFDDGTPATVSQMAKDVTTFLSWAAEPTQDERKRWGIKAMIALAVIAAPWLYYKKYVWAPTKTRVVTFVPPRTPNNPVG